MTPAFAAFEVRVGNKLPHPIVVIIDNKYHVVDNDNMKAEKLVDYKATLPNGLTVQAVIWRVPEPVPPTSHGFKYRLVAVKDGKRIIGFDNERGKGDHRHDGDSESPYTFTGVDQLMDDFLSAVKELS